MPTISVEKANHLLQSSGLNTQLTAKALAELRAAPDATHLDNAFNQMPSNQGAVEYVRRLLDRFKTGRGSEDGRGVSCGSDRGPEDTTRARRYTVTEPSLTRAGRSRAPDAGRVQGDHRPPRTSQMAPEHREARTQSGDVRPRDESRARGNETNARGAGAPTRRGSERDGDRALPQTEKAFGRKGALEWREHKTVKGTPTVMLEGALARGPRDYDWSNKVTVQIMPKELPAVACVLSGLLSVCRFDSHGPGKNKGYSLERQNDKVFVKVQQSGDKARLVAVPVPPGEAFLIYTLVLRQLRAASPGCDGAMVLSALRAFASLSQKR